MLGVFALGTLLKGGVNVDTAGRLRELLGTSDSLYIVRSGDFEMYGPSSGYEERDNFGFNPQPKKFSLTLMVLPDGPFSVFSERMERTGLADLWRMVRKKDDPGGFLLRTRSRAEADSCSAASQVRQR